jgi:hypothetical protein
MKKLYTYTVIQTIKKVYEIEASNKDDAEDKLGARWRASTPDEYETGHQLIDEDIEDVKVEPIDVELE